MAAVRRPALYRPAAAVVHIEREAARATLFGTQIASTGWGVYLTFGGALVAIVGLTMDFSVGWRSAIAGVAVAAVAGVLVAGPITSSKSTPRAAANASSSGSSSQSTAAQTTSVSTTSAGGRGRRQRGLGPRRARGP